MMVDQAFMPSVKPTMLASLGIALFCFVSWGCPSPPTPPTPTALPGGTIYFSSYGLNVADPYEVESATSPFTTAQVLFAGRDPVSLGDQGILAIINENVAIYLAPSGSVDVLIPDTLSALRDPKQSFYLPTFSDPQVSADGRYVAWDVDFTTRPGQPKLIFVADRATQSLTRIGEYDGSKSYSRPVWDASGHLYFQGNDSTPGLFRADLAARTITPIGTQLTNPAHPALSHDGRTLAFVMNSHIWTMGIDGSGLAQLTTSQTKEDYPAWSPDDRWIAAEFNGNVMGLAFAAVDRSSTQTTPLGVTFGAGQMDWK